MMIVCVMELRGGAYVGCRFSSREKADEWADKHDAEILASAPLISLTEAAGAWSEMKS